MQLDSGRACWQAASWMPCPSSDFKHTGARECARELRTLARELSLGAEEGACDGSQPTP